MASQTLIAGAGASVTTGETELADWVTPGNITADDGTTAVRSGVNNSEITRYLVSSSHGFTVPAGATIDGIVVEIDRSQSVAQNMRDYLVKLFDAAAAVGDNKADTATDWPTTSAVKTYGTSSDLWGHAWTVAKVNAAEFGVGISAKNTSATNSAAEVDFVRITVHYTEAAGTGGYWGVAF